MEPRVHATVESSLPARHREPSARPGSLARGSVPPRFVHRRSPLWRNRLRSATWNPCASNIAQAAPSGSASATTRRARRGSAV